VLMQTKEIRDAVARVTTSCMVLATGRRLVMYPSRS
jgi:RNA-binding protein YhbY